ARRRIPARLAGSRGERRPLPAWETWIEIGGLRKLRSGADRSFKTLPIAAPAYAKRGGKSCRAAASIQVLANARGFPAVGVSGNPVRVSPLPATGCRGRAAFASAGPDSTNAGPTIV